MALTLHGTVADNTVVLSRRNANPLIINGDMQIDQRNVGASITANDQTFVVDRFKFRCSQASKLTAEQVTDVPAGQGFSYSAKIISSSALSVGAADFFNMQTILEGQNITSLMFGSANAKTITLSFWVKSSLTGNFAVALNNFQGSARVYPAQYVINSANTWEKKTVAIPGDTSGTWVATNAAGLGILWSLGFGSNFNGTKNAWNGSDTNSFSGAVNLVATNAANLYITGVQLEVGDFDTNSIAPFQYESEGDSLIRCERYYEKSYNQGVALTTATEAGAAMFLANRNPGTPHTSLIFRTRKRTAPTITIYNSATSSTGYFRNLDASTNPAAVSSRIGENRATIYTAVSTTLGNFMQYHYAIAAEL